MKITIQIIKHELTCVEVVRAINRSRLNAHDDSPFETDETGTLRDDNGNKIGEWYTYEEKA